LGVVRDLKRQTILEKKKPYLLIVQTVFIVFISYNIKIVKIASVTWSGIGYYCNNYVTSSISEQRISLKRTAHALMI